MSGWPDWKKRDGKVGPYKGINGVVRPLFSIFIKLPFLMVIVLPIFLISTISRKLFAGKTTIPRSKETEKEIAVTEEVKAWSDRKFDIVFLGCTGVTGGLAAEYVAKNYAEKGIKFALAGRTLSKLEALKKRLVAINPACEDFDLVLADASDEGGSLAALCQETKVIATSAGPFARIGFPVVRQAIRFGCGYVDTTGEAAFVREYTAAYHRHAQTSGARIVSFCGADCIPYDTVTFEIVKHLNERNEKLKHLETFIDGKGTVSGGTLSTFLFHMNYHPAKADFNPMLLRPDGSKSPHKIQDLTRVGPGFSKINKSFYAWFYLTAVDRNCLQRSNTHLDWGSFAYKEQLELPNFFATVSWCINNILLACFIYDPCLRGLVNALGMLPEAGAGPSPASMDKGYLMVKSFGFGNEGTQVQTRLYFPTDTLYRDTARMFAESALTFILNDSEIESRGGCYTPASCFGQALIDRIVASGTEMDTRVIERGKTAVA